MGLGGRFHLSILTVSGRIARGRSLAWRYGPGEPEAGCLRIWTAYSCAAMQKQQRHTRNFQRDRTEHGLGCGNARKTLCLVNLAVENRTTNRERNRLQGASLSGLPFRTQLHTQVCEAYRRKRSSKFGQHLSTGQATDTTFTGKRTEDAPLEQSNLPVPCHYRQFA